jgi:putative tryptophan/tyrosine transport system substrate-binding protein
LGKVPTIYYFREFAVDGGLISYGIDLPDAYRQAAMYARRILKGANPPNYRCCKSTECRFVINLRTAKPRGLDMPPTLLARIDQVIE